MKPEDRPSLEDLGGRTIIRECPYCGCRDFRVTNTWYRADGTRRRKLICRHCGKYEFHTDERIVPP